MACQSATQSLVTIRHLQRICLDAVVRSNPNLGLDSRAEYFVQLFNEYLPRNSRVIDIGGGWGFYEAPLSARGHQVTVLDVVRPGVQKAPLVIYDGEEMPFPDKSFDAGLFITVLHHIPDPKAVIREAKRVVSKRLVVVEDIYHHPLGRFWTILRDRFFNFEYFGHPCQFRKKDEWIQLFKEEGFSLAAEKTVRTKLAGLSILNAVFVFDIEK